MRRSFCLLSVGVVLVGAIVVLLSISRTSVTTGSQQQLKETGDGCIASEEASIPASVVCKFYALASRGDVSGALELQTNEMPTPVQPAGTNRIVPVNSFNDPTWALHVKTGLDRLVKIKSEKQNDRYAVVVADTLERNGTKAAVTRYNLHLIRGKWKIFAVFDYSICEGNVDICHPVENPPS